jgi:hypothetical protein
MFNQGFSTEFPQDLKKAESEINRVTAAEPSLQTPLIVVTISVSHNPSRFRKALILPYMDL